MEKKVNSFKISDVAFSGLVENLKWRIDNKIDLTTSDICAFFRFFELINNIKIDVLIYPTKIFPVDSKLPYYPEILNSDLPYFYKQLFTDISAGIIYAGKNLYKNFDDVCNMILKFDEAQLKKFSLCFNHSATYFLECRKSEAEWTSITC